MQNAWRFVEDEVLRERLKKAKGIGTPATRAEIIGGLKKQGFLIAQGKHIVPTETGLSLFGILKQADPALVDPGLTAQMECLLDDVVTGKQEMVAAIDAVCDVAQRIIGKLKEGADGGGPPLLDAAVVKDKRARLRVAAGKSKTERYLSTQRCRAAYTQLTGMGVEKHDDLADGCVYLILGAIGRWYCLHSAPLPCTTCVSPRGG
jgi:DNA topoisomerase